MLLFKRKPPKLNREQYTVKKFAWLPTTMNNLEAVWLETYEELREHCDFFTDPFFFLLERNRIKNNK